MPSGVASSTALDITNSVPNSMGVRLNSSLVGCQEGSLKNRANPILCRMGKVSQTRNSKIRRTIAPETIAIPRSIQTKMASFRDWDKILLLDNILHTLRTSKINKVFRQSRGCGFRNQI